MAAPKGLKSLLNQVNKRDSKATGLAVEGVNFLKKRKNETDEEFERRKMVYMLKAAQRQAAAKEAMKKMK